jgi:rare lipoprotein A (peptidoglycan hydrolase)
MARVQIVAVRIALVSALLGVSAPTLAHAAGEEAFWPETQKLELGRPHWDLTGATVWDDMARMAPRWFRPAAPTPAPVVQDVAAFDAAPGLQTIAYSPGAPKLTGKAGWYGAEFDGRLTSSGERFDMYRLTAASADLPLNSYVSVSNRVTGETVVVRINDCRPQAGGDLITLSKAAATRLSLDGEGGGAVDLQLLGAAPSAGPIQVANR